MGREPERIPGLSVEADRRGRFQSAFRLNAAPGPAFGLADGRRLPSARQGRSYKHSERAHDEMIPVHPKKAKSRRHYFNILRGSFTTPVPRGVCLDDFQTNTRKQKRGSSQSSKVFFILPPETATVRSPQMGPERSVAQVWDQRPHGLHFQQPR